MATQMTKSKLIEKIAAETDLSKGSVKGVLDSLATVGFKELKRTGRFAIPGFAKFVVVREPATGRQKKANPFAGEPRKTRAKTGKQRMIAVASATNDDIASLPAARTSIADALAEAHARGVELVSRIIGGPEMESSDSLSKKIGLTRTAILAKRARHEILGLEGPKRGVKFPIWQFDAKTGKPFSVLPELFKLFHDEWSVYNFLTQHHPELDGRTGREALAAGLDAQLLKTAVAQARDFA